MRSILAGAVMYAGYTKNLGGDHDERGEEMV